ncbi:fimbrial protein [Enterobacter bugandensis]
MKKPLFFSLSIIMALLSINRAYAYTGECVRPDGQPAIINVDMNDLNVTEASDNDVNKVVVNAKEFKASGGVPYKGICDIPESEKTPVYLTTEVPLTKESGEWYSLNDYLSIRTSTFVNGKVQDFVWNPMKSVSNEYGEYNGKQTNWVTGGKVHISVKIKKKFVGFSRFNKLAIIGYANAYKTGVSLRPMFQVYISGGIIVPQSCELDAGTTVSMDFGNIGASLFSQAGAGNKPAGVNPKTHTIAVKCKNMDANALLSMRLESDNVSGNAMVSDNKDLGFVVAGSDKVPLTPNNIDSKIKFQLDENSAAMVPITAWPVSITGNKPAEGRFTAEGYLRVDFD